jgi:hypothetical protein
MGAPKHHLIVVNDNKYIIPIKRKIMIVPFLEKTKANAVSLGQAQKWANEGKSFDTVSFVGFKKGQTCFSKIENISMPSIEGKGLDISEDQGPLSHLKIQFKNNGHKQNKEVVFFDYFGQQSQSELLQVAATVNRMTFKPNHLVVSPDEVFCYDFNKTVDARKYKALALSPKMAQYWAYQKVHLESYSKVQTLEGPSVNYFSKEGKKGFRYFNYKHDNANIIISDIVKHHLLLHPISSYSG